MKKNWRSKHYHIRISRYITLLISLRKFRTKKDNRSKAYKQFVLLVNNNPHTVREIDFRIIKLSKRQGSASKPRLFMRPRFVFPIILIIFGLSGILYFGLQTTKDNKIEPAVTYYSPPTPEPTATTDKKPAGLTKSEPTNIRIARVGINTTTTPVGRLADGTMETPPALSGTAGWYKFSPTPGEIGPSVIVGHVDNKKGPSIFWRLRDIIAGDIVEITRADGQVVKFKVESLKQFDQANFPTEEVYGNINTAGLRLITCGGTFNRATKRYTQNTVVFASIVES